MDHSSSAFFESAEYLLVIEDMGSNTQLGWLGDPITYLVL